MIGLTCRPTRAAAGRFFRSQIFVALFVSVWLLGTGYGLSRLRLYAMQPGPSEQTPQAWPAESSLQLDHRTPRLIIFAHPLCPCTRATLTELAALLAANHRPLSVQVLFFVPSHPPADWQRGDLWDTAAAIPGVQVAADIDGVECRRFDAQTSGSARLYDAGGRLLFSGGLTDSRGHEGWSIGCQAILDRLTNQETKFTSTEVFGCSLTGNCRRNEPGSER